MPPSSEHDPRRERLEVTVNSYVCSFLMGRDSAAQTWTTKLYSSCARQTANPLALLPRVPDLDRLVEP